MKTVQTRNCLTAEPTGSCALAAFTGGQWGTGASGRAGGPADGEGPRMHGDLPSPKLCASVFCCLSLKIFRIWAVLPLEELISFKTENKLS